MRENLWPTPCARDWKGGAYPSEFKRDSPGLAARVGGKLNPTWVEWLMGWPIGWTGCEQSATDKFQQWRQLHFKFSCSD
jgi:hypothetical protein